MDGFAVSFCKVREGVSVVRSEDKDGEEPRFRDELGHACGFFMDENLDYFGALQSDLQELAEIFFLSKFVPGGFVWLIYPPTSNEWYELRNLPIPSRKGKRVR